MTFTTASPPRTRRSRRPTRSRRRSPPPTPPPPGPPDRSSFTVAPGAASKLHVTAQPSGASGGTAFSLPAGRRRRGRGRQRRHRPTRRRPTLAIAPGTPTSGGPGALSGCASSESLGVFTFSGCRITTAGSGYALTATDGSLTTATTAAFDVAVGPAAQLAIRTQPAGASGGSAFATQPQVAVEDAGGNVVDERRVDGDALDRVGNAGLGRPGDAVRAAAPPRRAASSPSRAARSRRWAPATG